MVSSRKGLRPTTFHSEHEPTGIRERLRRWQLEQDAASQVESADRTTTQNPSSMSQRFITRAHEINSLIESTPDEESRYEKLGVALNEDHAAEPLGDDIFLSQGDLVELLYGHSFHSVCERQALTSGRTFEEPTLGIYIRTVQQQAQFYAMDGRWINRLDRQIFFSVSGFAPRSEIAAILPYLPETDVPEEQLDQFQAMDSKVPRSVGSPLVDRMMKFSQASNDAYRKHADRIDNAYNAMADERNHVYAKLSRIASIVLGEPDEAKISKPTLWAVHRGLILSEVGFSVDHASHRTLAQFEILPRKEVDIVLQVREWVREYQEDIARRADPNKTKAKEIPDREAHGPSIILNFVQRARSIIQESRKYRVVTQTGSIGPCSVQHEPQQNKWTANTPTTRNIMLGAFSSNQTVIIRFMEFWAARRVFKPGSRLASMGSTILRATGMYDEFLLDEMTGYTFLQEIGVLAPWENRVAFGSRLAHTNHHFDFNTNKLQDEAAASLQSWTPTDSMRDLRTDWKDLEVFCIDSAGAREIDDGFSIEDIDGDGQHFWIHVHVANPTAFLSCDDPVAKYAAQLTESLYLPDNFYPMLDPAITQRFLSLAPNRPALTFSTKISIDGDIVDYKVTSSIVRNVHYFTPETLRENLLPPSAVIPTKRLYRVGICPSSIDPSTSGRPLSHTISKSQKEALQKVLQTTEARRKKRELRGAITMNIDGPSVDVHHNQNSLPYRRTVRRIEGDPGISMYAIEFEKVRSKELLAFDSVGQIVPEIMILACEVAALWCKERGVPMIYRGGLSNPETRSAAEYKEQVLDPATKEYGSPPVLVMLEYMHLCGRAISSVDPVRHVLVGTDAYTKVTSPLRRFGDMIAHWQIEAAIRKERETGKSLIGNTDSSFLPFPRDRLEAMIPRLQYHERLIKGAKWHSEVHWGIQLLQRAYYFKEATLPETYQVYVIGAEYGSTFIGYAKELNFEMKVEPTMSTRNLGGIQVGDTWECKIARLSCFQRRIYMEPIRLLERGDIKY